MQSQRLIVLLKFISNLKISKIRGTAILISLINLYLKIIVHKSYKKKTFFKKIINNLKNNKINKIKLKNWN